MSYILDALKKADAERERNGVPGLHSHPQAPAPDDGDSDSTRSQTRPFVWAGAGMAVSVIAFLSWQLWTRDTVPVNANTSTMPQAQSTAQAPAAEEAPQAAPMYQGAVPNTEPVSPIRRAPVATKPIRPVATAPSAAPDNPPGHSDPAQLAQIPTFSELPEDVRRELPVLTVGGAMYSETRSSRMVVLNSQIFHEGEQPAAGLVLEEIRLKSAVLNYKGRRYSINY